MKRILTLLASMLVLMALALPALAQETGDEIAEVINPTVTVLFLSVIVGLIVERVRARVSNLDGDLVTVVSLALGYGAALLWDLQVAADYGFDGLPVALDYLVGAAAIAGVAGILSAAKNALRARDPNSSTYQPS